MKRTMIVLSAAAIGSFGAVAGAVTPEAAPTESRASDQSRQETNARDAAAASVPAAHSVGVLASSGASGASGASGGCGGLQDNGDPDGVNGYANGTEMVFDGLRRTLLDDFEVPQGQTWTLTEFHHKHVWNTAAPGSGTGMEISIRSDAQGVPDATLVDVVVVSYDEMPGPGMYFGRAEANSWTEIEPLELDAGRYWFEATIVGPNESNFWLTAALQNSECWVNYEDFSGLQSGTSQFGSASDLSWCLTGTAGTGPTRQHGFKHYPLGAAALSDGGGSATLTVSNIGSSGKDGVSVELGDSAGGWIGHAAAAGAGTMTLTNTGTRDGTPDVTLGSTTAAFGAMTTIAADLTGLDAITYTRNLYLGGSLLDSQAGIPSGGVAAATSDSVGTGNCTVRRLADNVVWSIALDVAVVVDGVGEVDEVEIVPDAASAGIEALTSIAVNLADTGDFVITDESLIMFGNAHNRTGLARLTTEAGALRISNMGSSGVDGVDIDLGQVSGVDFTIDPVDVQASQREVRLSATGCIAEVPGSPLGFSAIGSQGGFTLIEADFDEISMTNLVEVVVVNDGKVVDSFVKNGGGAFVAALASGVPEDPRLPPLTGIGVQPVETPGYHFVFDAAVEVQEFLNVPFGMGDEVRIQALDPDDPVTAVNAFALRTANVGSVVFTGEAGAPGGTCGTPTGACCLAEVCTVQTEDECITGGGAYQGDEVGCTPETCVSCVPNADQTGEGCVDFGDIVVLLANWGNAGGPGDVNCDNVVDFGDIVSLLMDWGDGCP